jgi:hypothetical protein
MAVEDKASLIRMRGGRLVFTLVVRGGRSMPFGFPVTSAGERCMDFDLDTCAFFDRSQCFNLFERVVSLFRVRPVLERLLFAAIMAEQASVEGSQGLSSFGLPSEDNETENGVQRMGWQFPGRIVACADGTKKALGPPAQRHAPRNKTSDYLVYLASPPRFSIQSATSSPHLLPSTSVLFNASRGDIWL